MEYQPATSRSAGHRTQILLITAIVAVIVVSAGAVYMLLKAPRNISADAAKQKQNNEKQPPINQGNISNTNLPVVTLAPLTGKYNGGIDELPLDLKDIPQKFGTFTDYGASTGYKGQEGELIDNGIVLTYTLQISTLDFSATIPQFIDLYASPERAKTSYAEAKTLSEQVHGKVSTYSDVPFDHYYAIDTESYPNETSVFVNILDSNLLVGLGFRFPKTISVGDLKPLVDIVVSRLKNYQALTPTELMRQSAMLAMASRDETRQSNISALNDAISSATYNATTKQRVYPTTGGTISRSADGKSQVLTGSLLALANTNADFAKRIASIIPPIGSSTDHMTLTYIPKATDKSYVVFIQLEVPGFGWYYSGVNTTNNSLTEGMSDTKPI